MRLGLAWWPSLIILTLSCVPPAAATTYLTRKEALQLFFPGATRVEARTTLLSPEQRKAVQARLGKRVRKRVITFYRGWQGDNLLGYATVLNEIGKHLPITFMVGIDPGGRVTEVVILAYRESQGGEVRQRRFLRQYRGKALQDHIRRGKDIVNITGATLSVQSVSYGVRKALVFWEVLYGTKAPLRR
ncbi:FMN-binding protein [Nitrospinae bacterium AH_259_B05_G02_I21]|nr:FMN-binding protein [Nitrospinae bacterium AH_259_B05_G02_I21]